MPAEATAYRLFDAERLSERAEGDWHTFLGRWLALTLRRLTPFFERDVADFAAKRWRMQDILRRPYDGSYRLIHGDIFPGNLLADENGRIQALVDFGLFTMYGDPLFDAATAWVLFDMYDALRADARARLLPFMIERICNGAVGRLYRYVLLYSLLSADAYAADCSDGHYAWCVANLNTAIYWENIDD